MTVRAVLFDQASAEAVAARLVADGFAAHVVRERLHGEDDEDDHPWAVLSDAPVWLVDVVADQYDGWVDVADSSPAPHPQELPDGPRRVKGHFTDP